MKNSLLPLLLSGACSLAAQAKPFDFRLLHYASLPMHTSKAQLLHQLGRPTQTSRPHYECGGHVDEANKHYYQLHYQQATFIGNAAEGYDLEAVRFVPGGAELRYGTYRWHAATSLATIQRLFGADAQTSPEADGTVLVSVATTGPTAATRGDNQLHFIFKKGRLVAFESWLPC